MKKLENLSRRAVTSKTEAPKVVTVSTETLTKVVGGLSQYSGYLRGY